MNFPHPALTIHLPVSTEAGIQKADAVSAPSLPESMEMDENHPGQSPRQDALANALSDDSAGYSDTEHELGAYDEVMSVRRLRSDLARDLERIRLGGDRTPKRGREQTPPSEAGDQPAPFRACSAPSNLDRSSVDAQVVGLGDSVANAARAYPQHSDANHLQSPSSPSKKIRNALSRMMPARGGQGADLLGKSAPW